MEGFASKVEKRNRPPVSCEPCRKLKLKCDRGMPCGSCLRRTKAAACLYASNANRGSPGIASAKTRDIKDRLEGLERLVSSLASRQTEAKDSPTESRLQDVMTRTGGTPHLQESEDGEVNYIDPSHWQSILADIREVREHLSPSKSDSTHRLSLECSGQSEKDDASHLFGPLPSITISHILSILPPQPICDMLLSWYFGSRFMVLGIIHPSKFQDEYMAFWESPETTSPLWIALLLSVLSITVTLRQMANSAASDAVKSLSPAVLQEATVQCLVLGKYATANAYALEAFLLHLQGCFLSGGSRPVQLWFEMGTIIRLAFRMGYHRDPSLLAGVSTFDGEMRRRVWLNIVQIDALMSFHMGFPSTIPSQLCSTTDPKNFEFSDLQIEMTKLPPARPLSEHTPVLYTIVKSGVMAVFKKIVTHSQIPTPQPYNETLALEEEMRSTYSKIPEQYKRRDFNGAFTDTPGLILERCTIELLHLKGIIILLRPFISYDLKSPMYKCSKRNCVEAALDMLDRQADINAACAPGGRLHEDGWMFASIPISDYLLAAMVVCRYLSVRMQSGVEPEMETIGVRDLVERGYEALQTAQRICSSHSSNSADMRIAAEVMDLMLREVDKHYRTQFHASPLPIAETVTQDESQLPCADVISGMITEPGIVDWSILDQFFPYGDGSDAELMLRTLNNLPSP